MATPGADRARQRPMTTPRRSRRAAPAVLLAAAACAVGPAWTDDERRELGALEQAVLTTLAQGDAEPTASAMVTLPEGKDLGDVDVFLHVYPSLAGEAEGYRWSWSVGPTHPLPGMLFVGDGGTLLAIGGRRLGGFDHVHDLAVDPARGAVLLATRRGEQTVVTAQSTWSGSLWHRSFRPELSTDGSHFVHVADGWFRDRAMLAPTDAPERGVPISLPGVVQWPVWPGRDGSRVRSIVVVDGRVEVRDGDRVVATADSFANAFFDHRRDQLRVHLTTAGKTRILFGDRLSPPLDSYRWIDESRDGGHWLAAGRDGDRECVVYDDALVLRTTKLAWMDLSEDGSTWACAVQEGEQCFVVRPGQRSGPFPPILQLILAPDGSALAMCMGQGRTRSWTLDGQPLGAMYEGIDDVTVLPAKGGVVFRGRDAAGAWIVTPLGRDGPWDRVERCQVSQDGRRVVALAQRGREAHRRVLPLP